MLLKKKKGRRYKLPEVEVNVVSLMDILTTLLFFLVFAANFAEVSILQAKALPSGTSVSDPKPTFALDVMVKSPTTVNVYLAPVNRLKHLEPNDFQQFLKKEFKGNEQLGYLKVIRAPNTKELSKRIQAVLVPIKKSFPHENRAVLTFSDPIPYQLMVDLVGSLRSLQSETPAFKLVGFTGKTEMTRVLFPEVLIAEEVKGSKPKDGSS